MPLTDIPPCPCGQRHEAPAFTDPSQPAPTPHTCPVCGGRGHVEGAALIDTCASRRVTCHACAGSGIVWGPPKGT